MIRRDLGTICATEVCRAIAARGFGASSVSAGQGQRCDENLSGRLVDGEVSALLAMGETFEDEDGKGGRLSQEDGIKAYRTDRLALYDKVLGCRPGNEDIHNLANLLSEVPYNDDAFETLFHHLKGRSGEIADAYGNALNDLANDAIGPIQQRLKDEGGADFSWLDKAKLTEIVNKSIAENRDELSLQLFKAELSVALGRPGANNLLLDIGVRLGELIGDSVSREARDNIDGNTLRDFEDSRPKPSGSESRPRP